MIVIATSNTVGIIDEEKIKEEKNEDSICNSR